MKTIRTFNKTILGCLAALLILGTSCSLGVEGYGVLLWPVDGSNVSPGTYVTVQEQSKLNKTFTILPEGTGQKSTLEAWRVRFFSNPGDARNFQKKFQDVKELWAFAQRNALPVRMEMNNNARSVYKLGKGEKIKVLEKASEKVQVGMLEGIWYKVLTKEGFEGYCFDAVLKLVNGTQAVAVSADAAGDKYQSIFFENTWRPEYFKDMIKDEAIDVERFQANFMLKPKPEEKTVTIELPKDPVRGLAAIHLVFTYDDIVSINASQFRLDLKGATVLNVDFKGADRIYVRYKPGEGRPDIIQTFILLEDEEKVSEIVSRELSRRQELFNAIVSKGAKLTSPGFGTIVFGGDKSFTWEDAEDNRVTEVLKLGQGGPFTGQVLFDRFLDKELVGKNEYTWAMHLKFNQTNSTAKDKADRIFLYRLDPAGLLMVPAKQENTGFISGPSSGVPMNFTFTP